MLNRNHLLDGMRGIAALCVVACHVSGFFHATRLGGGYLAVDFFFILSGFVIASSYDQRLRTGMPPRDFIGRRIIRLYPLFALGTLFGLVKSVAQLIAGTSDLATPGSLVIATVLNSMMLPMPTGSRVLFPLNPPLWSLFCEIVINIVYVFVLVRLHRRWIVLLTIVGAAGLVVAVAYDPTNALDVGWSRSSLVFGLSRVMFGFCAGMLIASFRVAPRHHARWSLTLVAVLIAFMLVPTPGSLVAVRDLIFVFAAAPAIVWAAARTEVPEWAVSTCAFLGAISYPLYALHYPIAQAVVFVGLKLGLASPVASAIALVTTIFASIVAHTLYDEPIRRWLTRRALRPKAMQENFRTSEKVI